MTDDSRSSSFRSCVACHECDLLLNPPQLSRAGEQALCPRCGAMLYRQPAQDHPLESVLALAVTALILLVLANAFPVVGLNLKGHHIETTVPGAAWQLWADDMPAVALLLLATTLLMPLLELAALVWLILPLHLGWRAPGFVAVFRLLQGVEPWAMVEVFLLGVLVSLVKLAHLAEVLPGVALWCFAALMLVLAGLGVRLNHHDLWHAWEHAKPWPVRERGRR